MATQTTDQVIDEETREAIHRDSREFLPEYREDYDVVYENDEIVVFAGANREFDAAEERYGISRSEMIDMMHEECPSHIARGIDSPLEYGPPLVVRK